MERRTNRSERYEQLGSRTPGDGTGVVARPGRLDCVFVVCNASSRLYYDREAIKPIAFDGLWSFFFSERELGIRVVCTPVRWLGSCPFTQRRAASMSKAFEHLVLYSVMDRVTFANGQWLGADIPEAERTHKDVETCLLVWEYLNQAGAEGWELVSILETPSQVKNQPHVRTFFLKREIG